MRGILARPRGKRPSQAGKSLPRRPTPRSIIREIYREAHALEILAPIRKTKTNVQRELEGMGVAEKLARTLSFEAQNQAQALVSGLPAGKTAGTEPERLVAAWLVERGYKYGGQGYGYDQSKDWGFQVPLIGGRNTGGAVADIFLSAKITSTPRGTAVRVNGTYWHIQSSNAARDAAQMVQLISKGYVVADISDVEVLNPGSLNRKMSQLVGNSNRF